MSDKEKEQPVEQEAPETEEELKGDPPDPNAANKEIPIGDEE